MGFEEHRRNALRLLAEGEVSHAVTAHQDWCQENVGTTEHRENYFDAMSLGEYLLQVESITPTRATRLYRVWSADGPEEGEIVNLHEETDDD